ncbi:hypothetical protein [Gaiella occulta]|uniref:hypothetical protein n=1 Tax=Gaiella occulta TaxID=1002870 RepID=UPI0011C0550A|nr:hypothetical protein [Gaiella occulta]
MAAGVGFCAACDAAPWRRRMVVAMKLAGGLAIVVALVTAAIAAAAGPPSTPPSRVVGAATSPPPAWVETAHSSSWLAFSSFCWRTSCVDFIPPSARSDVPRLAVRPGEQVRFHFGFRPRQTLLRRQSRTFVLTPARTTGWRVATLGLVTITVRSRSGTASYIARLVAR